MQLQALAQQQSEALLRRLSRDDDAQGGAKREIPSRPLPFGSESLYSPTYVAQSGPPSVLSPQPIKGKGAAAGLVQDLTEGDPDMEASGGRDIP